MFLFNSGYSYSSSSVNLARSAISFFSLDIFKIGDNPIVSRLFKYFYNNRPLRPRYFTYWPVSQLLEFLAKWHPIHTLSLRQLTLKVLALISLTSSDRGQTLHLININYRTVNEDGISFVIFDQLKNSRRTVKPKVVNCVVSDIDSLNVAQYVSYYLEATEPLRADQVSKGQPKPSKLFISWATKKEVTRQTISRWLTTVLSLAGIDTNQFSSHSFRGAGTSAAYNKGASVEKILEHGGVVTFRSHYSLTQPLVRSHPLGITQLLVDC